MMYAEKMATAIKVNGRVLRENKDTVYIPFGSEYSILLKNLNTVKALINVFVDGKNVTEGGLVLDAGQELDLERSILSGNLQKGNKFKFIERTGSIEKHRGVKLEDGLVRVEFQFEKVYLPPLKHTFVPNNYWDTDYYNSTLNQHSLIRSSVVGSSCKSYNNRSELSSLDMDWCEQDVSATATQSDIGITVEGSVSDQQFKIASWFPVEEAKHSIVLKLLGHANNKPIVEPITVRSKPKCVTCGRNNKVKSKFCVECGTSLEIIA